MGLKGWGLRGEAFIFTPLVSPLLPLCLSDTGWECVGKEGPGALAQQNGSACVSVGSRSVLLSWCHCNSRRLTSDPDGFTGAQPGTPTMPKGTDCHLVPTRWYPSFLLCSLRSLWYITQGISLSSCTWILSHPTTLSHSFRRLSLSFSAFWGGDDTFTLSNALFIPCACISLGMNIVSAARCRKYIIWAIRQW